MWGSHGEKEEKGDSTTEREIDVEAPSPAETVGKDSPEKGPDHASNTEHGAEDTGKHGSSMWRKHDPDDSVCAVLKPRTADPLDGSAGDKSIIVLSGGTDQATQFEDEESTHDGPLQIE